MAGWDGAGNFTRAHDWTDDANSNIDIEASRMDTEDDNFAAGINACLAKNGENTATQINVDNLRLDGNDITSTNINGNIVLDPNGTGTVNIDAVAITGGSITGITDLAVADGGTGASTAADARTNLGLGTIATQNANSVSVTGGTLSGVTLTSPTINDPSIGPSDSGLLATFGNSAGDDYYVRFRNFAGQGVDFGFSLGLNSGGGGGLIFCGESKNFGIAVNASGTDFATAVDADLAFVVTSAGLVKTKAALEVGTSIELGHASDTTFTRPAAGRAQIEGREIVTATASATQLTATIDELNTLDGITATVSELNILDGVTATAAEINLACDGSEESSFTGTLTGMSSATQGTVNYVKTGKIVYVWITAAISGTSNATTMTMTGLPSSIRPTNTKTCICGKITDASSDENLGIASISSSGVVTFNLFDDNDAGRVQAIASFAGAGTKGLAVGWTITYPVD